MSSISQKVITNIKNRTFKKGFTNLVRRIFKKIKYSNLHYFLNKERVLTKKYETKFQTINNLHTPYANYFLDNRIKLSPSTIVYSFGILNDVGFETALSKKADCVINMFDPTPLTIEFMKDYKDYKKFNFKPIGLWNEDKVLSFYTPKEGGSSSAVLDIDGSEKFDAPCFTLGSIMKQIGHSEIDILKMDIEGAALPAMLQFFSEGIYPVQIIAEFERPRKNLKKVNEFFDVLDALNKNAVSKGYEIFLIPRPVEKYYAVELLYVKIKN